MPKVGEGDYLALLSAGAYGFVMASNYNARPLAAEILVNGKKAAVARERQAGERNLVGRESCGMVEDRIVNNEYSIAAHWPGGFDEAGLRNWAETLRRQFPAPKVSLGLVFMSPKFFPHAKQALEILRVHARIPLLAGLFERGADLRRQGN